MLPGGGQSFQKSGVGDSLQVVSEEEKRAGSVDAGGVNIASGHGCGECGNKPAPLANASRPATEHKQKIASLDNARVSVIVDPSHSVLAQRHPTHAHEPSVKHVLYEIIEYGMIYVEYYISQLYFSVNLSVRYKNASRDSAPCQHT